MIILALRHDAGLVIHSLRLLALDLMLRQLGLLANGERIARCVINWFLEERLGGGLPIPKQPRLVAKPRLSS